MKFASKWIKQKNYTELSYNQTQTNITCFILYMDTYLRSFVCLTWNTCGSHKTRKGLNEGEMHKYMKMKQKIWTRCIWSRKTKAEKG